MSTTSGPETQEQYANDSSTAARHRLRPGQDGYLTPTIEDFDHPANARNRKTQGPGPLSTQKNAAEYTSAHEKRESLQQHQTNQSSQHNSSIGKLGWKRRIKHITWAYFTLTMATGGMNLRMPLPPDGCHHSYPANASPQVSQMLSPPYHRNTGSQV